jgi:cobalt/nickel transport system ATP-binding protein
MKPKVLLLDEPTTGLDTETTERIINILNEIDISYIFISHNIDFIVQTAYKIYGMINGQISLEEEKVAHSHTHLHGFGRLPHIHSQDKQSLTNKKR